MSEKFVMCSKYELTEENHRLNAYYKANPSPFFKVLRPKIAFPGNVMPIIYHSEGRRINTAFWGLHPPRLNSDKERMKFMRSRSSYNARSERLTTAPTWRNVWARGQRCIIPATRFYEWIEIDGKKVSQGIESGNMLSLAGIFSGNQEIMGSPFSFSMITTRPNSFMERIHDRMPVILDDWEKWLDPLLSPEEAYQMLRPWSGDLRLAE